MTVYKSRIAAYDALVHTYIQTYTQEYRLSKARQRHTYIHTYIQEGRESDSVAA